MIYLTRQSTCNRWLKARGFNQVVDCKVKVAGVVKDWFHQDGHKATVKYGLYSQTAQDSLDWGYAVTID